MKTEEIPLIQNIMPISASLVRRFTVSLLVFLLFPFYVSASEWMVKDSVLVIAGGTREIPSYAFKDRTDIREVRFEEPVRLSSVGEYAFLGCSSLRSITLPSGLLKLGEGCFRECVELTAIVIPATVKEIPKGMCMWNVSLTDVVFPSALRDIGAHAFAYCRALASVKIPASVEHIGSNAFSRCSTLSDVELPRGMKELESYAFSDCVSLKSAILPANSNLLGELIFSGCVSLRSITVNSMVPPRFDCASSLFEPDEAGLYEACRLIVPPGARAAYRRAPGWSLFPHIL